MTDIDRRTFLTGLSVASGLTIVPRRVLGGPGYVAPSDMVRAGAGRLRHCSPSGRSTPAFVKRPDVQFVAVVDPNRDSQNYVDWSEFGNRNQIRRFLEEPQWGASDKGIRGGREVAREIMETYYRKQQRPGGIRAYEDYREMLEKETDIQGVINITPDHQHGSINIAALRKGQGRNLAQAGRERALRSAAHAAGGARQQRRVAPPRLQQQSPTGTRSRRGSMPASIGAVREVHNWTNRPFWPQGMQAYHASGPPVPDGFNWALWQGPEPDRPVPSELHVRRVSRLVRLRHRLPRRHGALQPVAAVPHPQSRRTGMGRRRGRTTTPGSTRRTSAPAAASRRSACRARAASGGGIRRPPARPAVDTFWYDGGMKPQTPEELYADSEDLADEGMLIVGDKGKILCDFRGNAPRLLPRSRQQAFSGSVTVPEFDSDERGRRVGQRDQVRQEVEGQLRGGRGAR